MFLLAKYNTALTIEFPVIKRGVVDYAVGADWTAASGDVKISKDGGAASNTTNLPSAVTMGNTAVWQLTLTATEMSAARIVVTISDSATKAVEDQAILILTCGHASAWFVNDLTATQYAANVTQFGGTNGTFASGRPEVNASHIAGSSVSTSTAQIGVNVVNFGGSAGTFASGRPEVNTSHIAGSAVSTSSAQIGVNVVNAGGTAWGSGAITSGVFAAGSITASAIAADAIGASELAADAVAEIADAVWDEVLSGHLTSGTTGAGLNAAGSAGDPWSTALPGAYSAGTAGYIVGTNLNATVSSRLATASYTAPLDAAGTRSALGLASANLDTQLTTIDDYLDTEIAAIKAKTDNLPATPASTSDIPSATTIADAVLSRNVSNVEGSAPEHSLCTIVLASLESSISGTTWTIKRTNGSTTHATKTVTVDASADPITGVS